MGAENKLLLPWKGETVMDQVLRAWTESSATRVIAVVRQDNLPLQEICRRWSTIDLLVPEHDPKDMKRSIQLGLLHLSSTCQPDCADRWMVAPADLPTLTAGLIDQLIDASRDSESIVAPRFGDRRGHPVCFPWSLLPDVFRLGHDEGINTLMENHFVQWLDLPAEKRPVDIDTPADYARLRDGQTPPAAPPPTSEMVD